MSLSELQRELVENEEERLILQEAKDKGWELPQDKYRSINIIFYIILGISVLLTFLYILYI